LKKVSYLVDITVLMLYIVYTKLIIKMIMENTSKFSKGQTVARLMERHNPQLGVYYVFTKSVIDRVNKRNVSIENDISKYDKLTGHRSDKDGSVYGSAYYQIMDIETAKKRFAELEQSGSKVRGMEDILKN